MFRTVSPSIIRSSRLYTYSNRHLSNRYCCLLDLFDKCLLPYVYSLELLMMDGETVRNM